MNDFALNSDEETLEIEADAEAMAAIRQGGKEISEGKVVTWEELKDRLKSE